MKYTAIICHVMVDLVAEGKLHISRNGAGEPGIGAYDRLGSPYSQRRLLTTVQKLHEQGMISFSGKGIFNLYLGKAEIAPVGRNRMHHVQRAHEAHKALAEKHASEQEALRRQHEAEVVQSGLGPTTDVQVRARQNEAILRVSAFLKRHAARDVTEKDFIAGFDEHELRASDLTMLLNAVLDSREGKR